MAVREERLAQQKLYDAEAEVDARYWKREILISLFRRSQRFQVQQANRWADQAQRYKISLYEELEVRNRIFQENHARD